MFQLRCVAGALRLRSQFKVMVDIGPVDLTTCNAGAAALLSKEWLR